MVSKVLCITLLACTFVHAAPKHSFLPGDPNKLIDKIEQAAISTLDENELSFATKVDSGVEASKALFDAGKQSVETKLIIAKLPIRFISKLFSKTKKSEGNAEDEALVFIRTEQADESTTKKPEDPTTKQ